MEEELLEKLLEKLKLTFTKSWTSPNDFPTYEADETQVRADMQQLHNETRDHINGVIAPAFAALLDEASFLSDRIAALETSVAPTVIVPERLSPDVALASYTIEAADSGATILCTGDAELSTSIDVSRAKWYTPGMEVEIVRFGDGSVSLHGDSDVRLFYKGCADASGTQWFSLPARYAAVRLKCLTCEYIGTGEYQSTWLMTGDLS